MRARITGRVPAHKSNGRASTNRDGNGRTSRLLFFQCYRHDPRHAVNFFLYTLIAAYREFEKRVGDVQSPKGAKSEMVLTAIRNAGVSFRVADLHRACPGVSVNLIRRVLKNLRAEGKVECLGRGQQTQWRRLTDELGSTQ